MKKIFITVPSILVMVLGLSACEDLFKSKSSAGQEFIKFTPEVEVPPPPKPEPKEEDPKDTPSSDSSDDTPPLVSTRKLAGNGILWKPVSEKNGNLVVLTATSYGTPKVSILNSKGNRVETGDYQGHTNGNRATYRFSKTGGAYSKPSYLQVSSTIFLVDDPRQRHE